VYFKVKWLLDVSRIVYVGPHLWGTALERRIEHVIVSSHDSAT
jgi:hypothetical protein